MMWPGLLVLSLSVLCTSKGVGRVGVWTGGNENSLSTEELAGIVKDPVERKVIPLKLKKEKRRNLRGKKKKKKKKKGKKRWKKWMKKAMKMWNKWKKRRNPKQKARDRKAIIAEKLRRARKRPRVESRLSASEKRTLMERKRKEAAALAAKLRSKFGSPGTEVVARKRNLERAVKSALGARWRPSYQVLVPVVGHFTNCVKGSDLTNSDDIDLGRVCYGEMWHLARSKQFAWNQQLFWWAGRALRSFLEDVKEEGEMAQQRTDETLAKLLLLERVFQGSDWVYPSPGFFGAAAVTAVLFCFTGVLLVAGFVLGYWSGKVRFLMLLGCLFVSLGLQVVYWVFTGTGYQVFGRSLEVPGVQKWQLDVLGRISNVLTMGVLAMFSFVIFAALLPVFSSERQRAWRLAVGVCSAVLCVSAGAYGIAMVVVNVVFTDDFIFDASTIVLSACLVLFTAELLAVVVIVLLKKGISEASVRSARIFAVVASLALAIFVTRLVISVYFAAVDWSEWQTSFLVLQCVSSCFIAVAVILYFSTQMISSWRTKQGGRKLNSEGYVSLSESGMSQHVATPSMYEV